METSRQRSLLDQKPCKTIDFLQTIRYYKSINVPEILKKLCPGLFEMESHANMRWLAGENVSIR